jgi:hypothetical protein
VLVKYRGKAANMVVPEGVTEIGKGAFEGNKTLASVILPAGFTAIAGYIMGNTAPLVQVQSGGNLVMEDGSKITGNTNGDDSGSDIYGGSGVYVSNGNFTMHGGTITSNTAQKYGGGRRHQSRRQSQRHRLRRGQVCRGW